MIASTKAQNRRRSFRMDRTVRTKTRVIAIAATLSVILLFMSAVAAQRDGPTEPPEFYFTRLVYSENGVRSMFTMRKPPPFTCPEFGGGRFFPGQGWGWATDYPGGDC